MNLLRSTEFEPSPDQAVFRESRVAGTIAMTALGGICLAAGPVTWSFGAPWFIWTPCLAVALLPLLAFPRSIRALYSKSNWVVAADREALWINLRSPFNYHFPDGRTVLRLELTEISEVSLHSERYSTPGSEGGSTTRAMESLQLKLAHAQTESLVEALQEERNREPVPGKGFVSMKLHHYPISLPEPDTIRIAWRGSTMEDRITPVASRVIQILTAAGVPVRAPASVDRDGWRALDDPELDSLVKDLTLSGQTIEAVKLLRERQGLGLAEAMRRVNEIAARSCSHGSSQ